MTGAHYMALVAGLCCCICALAGHDNPMVEVHHRRDGTGGGRRASDFDTMPLCVEHHRGDTGIHGLGTKLFARTYATTEETLVADTRQRLGVSAEQVEIWKQEVRDRRRKVPKPKGGKKAPGFAGHATRWPSRKLATRSSFRPRAASQD